MPSIVHHEDKTSAYHLVRKNTVNLVMFPARFSRFAFHIAFHSVKQRQPVDADELIIGQSDLWQNAFHDVLRDPGMAAVRVAADILPNAG